MKKIYLLMMMLFTLICLNIQAQQRSELYYTNFSSLPITWEGTVQADILGSSPGSGVTETKYDIVFNSGTQGMRILYNPTAAAPTNTLDPAASTGRLLFNGKKSTTYTTEQGAFFVLPKVTNPTKVVLYAAHGSSKSSSKLAIDVLDSLGTVLETHSTATFSGQNDVKKFEFELDNHNHGNVNIKVKTQSTAGGTDNSTIILDLWVYGAEIIATDPTISTVSDTTQTVYANTQALSEIIFKWGGTATSATIKWTGTANEDMAPDSVVVTTDNDKKTLTITGKLITNNSYGYSITATDGTKTTDAITGTLTGKTTSKKILAYVTTPGDVRDNPFITALSADFDVNIISAVKTGVDYSFYDVIVVSAIPASDASGLTELKNISITKPCVNMKTFLLQSNRWNWISGQANNTTNASSIKVLDKTHPLFNGVTYSGEANDEVVLTTVGSGNQVVTFTGWAGTPTPELPTVLATKTDNTSAYNYAEIPAGTIMNGMSAPMEYKHVILGLSEASWGALTDDAIRIVENAVNYVLGNNQTPTTVATPVISVDSISGKQVAISCSTPGVAIYYTTNGITPSDTIGTLYTAPFNITTSCTVKAFAVRDTLKSGIASREILLTGAGANRTIAKLWNFTVWSAETLANLRTEATSASNKWYCHEVDEDSVPKRYKNWGASVATLVANSVEIEETKGLLFPAGLTGGKTGSSSTDIKGVSTDSKGDLSIRFNFGDNGIQCGSSAKAITIKDLKKDQIVTVLIKSASGGSPRGISAVTNMSGSPVGDGNYGTGNDVFSYEFKVSADGDVTFTYNAGIILKYIKVEDPVVNPITVAAPAITVADAATGKDVTINCATEGATIYYTTNGITPSDTTGTLYTAPFNVTTSCTVKAIAVKDTVKSEVTSQEITIAVIPVTVATPVIAVADAATGKDVSINCATEGATIYYTIDGKTPSATSTLYANPFNVTTTCTVMAIAVKDTVKSEIASQEITISSGVDKLVTVKLWDFTVWSAETLANLRTEATSASNKWYCHDVDQDSVPKRYKNWGASVATLVANGVEIEETKGILFPAGLTGGSKTGSVNPDLNGFSTDGKGDLSIRCNFGDNGIQCGSSNKTLTIKDLKKDQIVTITLKSASGSERRGILSVTNMTGNAGASFYPELGAEGSNSFTVNADGNVTFTYNGGIILKSIKVEMIDKGVSVKTTEMNDIPVSQIYYDITGKQVEKGTKGFIIEKSIYEDGSVRTIKLFVK